MISQPKKAACGSLKSMLMGAFLLNAALSPAIFAQTENKLQKDPTYSIHNYKHPNKATAARAWQSELVLGQQSRDRRQVRMGDYKRTANIEPGASRLVFRPRRNRETNPELVSGYNYKNPRPSGVSDKREARRRAKPTLIEAAEETPTGNE